MINSLSILEHILKHSYAFFLKVVTENLTQTSLNNEENISTYTKRVCQKNGLRFHSGVCWYTIFFPDPFSSCELILRLSSHSRYSMAIYSFQSYIHDFLNPEKSSIFPQLMEHWLSSPWWGWLGFLEEGKMPCPS